MDEKRDLPLCLLQAFSLLVPGLTEAFKKTKLTPTDLFVLSSIKYLGQTHSGQQIFLGKPMRDILRTLFGESPPQITKRIGRLEDRGLLTRVRLSSEAKEKLFGKQDGKKFALVLCENGSKTVDEFNDEINALFSSATAGLRNPSTSLFSPELQDMTEELVKHLGSRYDVPNFIGDGLEITEKDSLGSKSDISPVR